MKMLAIHKFTSFVFTGCPADGEPQPSSLLQSHPQQTDRQTSRSQESASLGLGVSLCVVIQQSLGKINYFFYGLWFHGFMA